MTRRRATVSARDVVKVPAVGRFRCQVCSTTTLITEPQEQAPQCCRTWMAPVNEGRPS